MGRMICGILHSERVGFMLGTIVAVVVVLVLVVLFLCVSCGRLFESVSASIFIALVFWIGCVYGPVEFGHNDQLKKYYQIQAEITYVENRHAELSLDECTVLYGDIVKYNKALHSAREAYGNVWNGVFIDDAVLTMEEIPMPEWLQKID